MTFSLSQVITDVENWISTTEADLENWVVQIQSAVPVLATDLQSGLKFIASVAPGISSALSVLMLAANAIPGLQIPAAIGEAIAGAAAGLNAVAQQEAAGSTNGATLVAAYQAYNSAKAAHTSLMAVIAAAPTPAPAATAK